MSRLAVLLLARHDPRRGRARRTRDPPGQARRPDVHAPGRLHDRARRRAAAGRSAHRRRLRRAGPALRRRLVRAPTTRCRSSSREAAPHRPAGGHATATASSTSATVFADKMMFPEGTHVARRLALRRRPRRSIWKLTDTDGDGVADQREEWFQGKTLTGCANDLHGPYLGPDGWIYWCKGAFAEQTYELPGKKPFVTRAVAHLPLPARRHGHRAGDDRRHGQPGRRRLHARRRADLHDAPSSSIPAAASATA